MKSLGISGDAAGVWNFWVTYREAACLEFSIPRTAVFKKKFRGFPDMELGTLRAASSLPDFETTQKFFISGFS